VLFDGSVGAWGGVLQRARATRHLFPRVRQGEDEKIERHKTYLALDESSWLVEW
jgi:hypothetical protein